MHPAGLLMAGCLPLTTHAMRTDCYPTQHLPPSQALALTPDAQAEVDLASVIIRGRPLADAEGLVPGCPRCSAASPLVNTQVGPAEGWS